MASLAQPHPDFLDLPRSVFGWSEGQSEIKNRVENEHLFYSQKPKFYRDNVLDKSDCRILRLLISGGNQWMSSNYLYIVIITPKKGWIWD